VDGDVHTNSLESFWSLLKRSISGTYVSVEPFHLFRYLDEQSYRFNNRKDLRDFDRFKMAAAQIVGKRLTSHGMRSPARITNRKRAVLTAKEAARQKRGKRLSGGLERAA
jgi:hypothetical protein